MASSTRATALRPWLAEFRDPLREHAFRSQEVLAGRRGLYLGLAVVLATDVVSAWFDWRLFGAHYPQHLWHVLSVRLAMAMGTLATLAVLRWRPSPPALAWTALGLSLVLGVMQSVVGYEHVVNVQRGDNLFWHALFAFLVLTVPPVSLRFGLANAAAVCLPALVLELAVLDARGPALARMLTLFTIAVGMGAVLANRHGRGRRLEFALLATERQINVLLQSEVDQRTATATRLQEDKSELEARLQRAQQLEAIGRLAAGVAHDLNNVLTPILGYSDLAQTELGGREPDVAAMVREINAAAVEARNLVDHLLAFGRRQALVRVPLDLNRLLAAHDGMIRKAVGDAVRVEVEPASEPVVAQADATQIGRVLMNLAVNAADAMRAGGTLTLRVGTREVDRDEGLAPGRYAVLTVRDTGTGMDENTRQHLFEPFFTTKRKGHSGLGLATSYGIVQQHGGSIRLTTSLGEGTAFDVYLPASSGSTTDAVLDAGAGAGGDKIADGDETVLVAEDDEEVRRLLHIMLTRLGFRVLSSAGGGEALAMAEQHPGRVDVLLSDVSMPGMSGPELWSSLRKRHPETRVLFTSGFTDQIIGGGPEADGRAVFLKKPFMQRDLARKLRALINEPKTNDATQGPRQQ